MVGRRLYYTPGSPFGRAIRIIMDEIGIEWMGEEANIKDSVADRQERTPALQVPTLFDGDLTLWDSGVIAEYLFATYPQRRKPAGVPPLAAQMFRPSHHWADKLLFASVQTLGQSTVLVSQMRWSGTTAKDNAHVARNADRILSLCDWFEGQLPDAREGFVPGVLSVQDIFCVCHLMFMTHRPLEIAWDIARTPKLAALCDRLQGRQSFKDHPIAWWEPGMAT